LEQIIILPVNEVGKCGWEKFLYGKKRDRVWEKAKMEGQGGNLSGERTLTAWDEGKESEVQWNH